MLSDMLKLTLLFRSGPQSPILKTMLSSLYYTAYKFYDCWSDQQQLYLLQNIFLGQSLSNINAQGHLGCSAG